MGRVFRFSFIIADVLCQDASGKWESFQLFCCIHEASMIDRKTASKPIQFEMNIGKHMCNFYASLLIFILNQPEMYPRLL